MDNLTDNEIKKISHALIAARQSATTLTAFPGDPPRLLTDAYAIQDHSISHWPDRLTGWKVGRIIGPDIDRFQADRLLGPIFEAVTVYQPSGTVEVGIYDGGFGAVEGECVLILGQDAPSNKVQYTTDEARALVGSAHVGIEIASSPFAGINDHGPLVTISDFGNNNGLIIGEALMPEQGDFQDWGFITEINGVEVGRARSSSIPGGPLESFRHALENAAQRGMPLKKGCAITTGAITGIHEISAGQTAQIMAEGLAPLAVHVNLMPIA